MAGDSIVLCDALCFIVNKKLAGMSVSDTNKKRVPNLMKILGISVELTAGLQSNWPT